MVTEYIYKICECFYSDYPGEVRRPTYGGEGIDGYSSAPCPDCGGEKGDNAGRILWGEVRDELIGEE